MAPLMEEALALVVEVTGARQAWLAVDRDGRFASPAFALSHAMTDDDVASVRERLSTGIIAEALRTGRTIATASAVEDPRFKALRSVQAGRIQAVLCAPLGETRPLGVLYLQGRAAPGPFPERVRSLTETFARRVAPFAHRLLDRAGPGEDPTARVRARLKADALVGRSRALADVLTQLAVAASQDVYVLLTGPSGTGKTELARCLHENSRRAPRPFVELNCAALPEALLEAELYGAEKGAHSTATRKILGKVAAAEGGTLFLDEIAEIPLTAQAKLLQFLQSRRYYPLGASTPVQADVRVVAATNTDLPTAVREKRFREDLYYRLGVLELRVPALRDRAEDIPLLAAHLARLAGVAMGRALTVSRAAQSALSCAEWPGNVRQLAAAVQRGAAFAIDAGSDVIEVWHLFPESARDSAPEGNLSWQEATRRFHKRLLEETLASTQGNVSEAARRLDLARTHLHELLKAHGLGRKS
ncbi:MAG: sigma-54-dependent Fis family transcriptional regulator [Deltaproteobacteria bacterium]|nr:sigma-54-dependent Fis family transcriptional regulator [Deltaproteobacteria bacterium]